MQSRYMLAGKNKIHYQTIGKGDPLVLLHGYQTDSRLWQSAVPFLKDHFKLILPDFPGHGASTIDRKLHDMGSLAEVVQKICLSNGYLSVSIAGHSMGGYVAMAFAEKYARMVDKLYLINSHPFEDGMNKVFSRERESQLIENGKEQLLINRFIKNSFSPDFQKLKPDLIQKFTEIALKQSPNGMLADLVGMMARNNKPLVARKLREKIVVILGEKDLTITEDLFEKYKDLYHIDWIANCGHMSVIEKPEEVAKILISNA